MLAIFLSTFCIIFIAELPDKTALATLMLSTRYRARDVIAGAWAAFLVQTVVGVAAGSVLTLLPVQPIRIASGLGFLVFAVLAFRRKEEDNESEEAQAVSARSKPQRPAWLISFLLIFAAEWGDLTQLATVALVAGGGHPLTVGLGAVLALWTVTLLAAYSGSRLGKFLELKLLNRISGVIFAAIGLFIIWTAVFPHGAG